MEEACKLPSVMTATSGRSNTGITSNGTNQDKGHRGKGQNPPGVRNSWLQLCLRKRMYNQLPMLNVGVVVRRATPRRSVH